MDEKLNRQLLESSSGKKHKFDEEGNIVIAENVQLLIESTISMVTA